jgi:hypothetical protein
MTGWHLTSSIAAMMRSLSSCFDAARTWRRIERELGEDLDELSQGPCLGVKGELETADRHISKPSSGLCGDVHGMIVEDQLDHGAGRIGGVELLGRWILGRRPIRSLPDLKLANNEPLLGSTASY